MSKTLYFIGELSEEWIRPWGAEFDLNMSEGNSWSVLTALGFGREEFDGNFLLPQEIHAACQRFLTSDLPAYIDGGVAPTRTDTDGRGATVIHCGRREGYLEHRVRIILEQSSAAMLAGARRCYFS